MGKIKALRTRWTHPNKQEWIFVAGKYLALAFIRKDGIKYAAIPDDGFLFIAKISFYNLQSAKKYIENNLGVMKVENPI